MVVVVVMWGAWGAMVKVVEPRRWWVFGRGRGKEGDSHSEHLHWPPPCLGLILPTCSKLFIKFIHTLLHQNMIKVVPTSIKSQWSKWKFMLWPRKCPSITKLTSVGGRVGADLWYLNFSVFILCLTRQQNYWMSVYNRCATPALIYTLWFKLKRISVDLLRCKIYYVDLEEVKAFTNSWNAQIFVT